MNRSGAIKISQTVVSKEHEEALDAARAQTEAIALADDRLGSASNNTYGQDETALVRKINLESQAGNNHHPRQASFNDDGQECISWGW